MQNTIPLGYCMKDGKIAIHESDAEKVKLLFRRYLDCFGINESAKYAGIKRCHSSVGHILADKRYLGDEFYSQIISTDIFEQVQKERNHRAVKLGRLREYHEQTSSAVRTEFTVPNIEKKYKDPLKQAEYAYSQILESEVQRC